MGIEEKIQKNIPLAPLTTFKIGGLARMFLEISTKEEFTEAMEWCKHKGEKFFILGGGSNILVNDDEVNGLVVKFKNDKIAVYGERLECNAGASLAGTVRLAVGNGLSGLEWAAGIPGTIGGAVRGNAGAYGSSMKDAMETAEIYSLKTGKFYKISNNDCEFGYRDSLFKKNSDLIIWQATLKLNKSNSEIIRQTVAEYLEKREKTQPKLPSAGCIFKNIQLTALELANPELAKQAEAEKIIKNGMVGAGWVIDQLGLRGKNIGGAKVSLEHANFIVNTGKATAAEVVMLISYIKQQVRDKQKIQLQEEVQYFGF